MSPFIHNLFSKHGRRVLTPPHVRYVEEVQNFHRRTDTFQASKGSFDDIINRWWGAFAVGGLILIMLLVVAGVGLVRCIRRRWPRSTAPGSDINEKENGNGKATAPPLRSIPFSPPPHIMITPATASPTKLRFSLDTDETLADLADSLKCGDKFADPELGHDLHKLEYQKAPDNLVERNFDGSEVGITHVHTPEHPLAYQLPRYHSEDPSEVPRHGREGEAFDEIDLHSPGAGQVNLDSDPEMVSGTGASEPELTEAELSTLMLQFPPPAYSKTSKPMHQIGEKTLPPRPGTEPQDDPYTRHAVRHFAFHRPTTWQNRPVSPRSAANLHASSSTSTPEPRSNHSPAIYQARSWTQARDPINIRSGPVSDRYATRQLAMETTTAPRWSDLQRERKDRKEEEMRDIA